MAPKPRTLRFECKGTQQIRFTRVTIQSRRKVQTKLLKTDIPLTLSSIPPAPIPKSAANPIGEANTVVEEDEEEEARGLTRVCL